MPKALGLSILFVLHQAVKAQILRRAVSEMSKKSCFKCEHVLVCKKWQAARDFVYKEWGGTPFPEVIAGMRELLGGVCKDYGRKGGKDE